jgi:Tol biopolymer transport system component
VILRLALVAATLCSLPSALATAAEPQPGGTIAFTRRAGTDDSDCGIHLLDLRSGALRRISAAGDCALAAFWSRDGKRLAYSLRKWGFVVADAQGRTVQELRWGRGSGHPLAWSPNGRHVAFGATPFGTAQLWIWDLEQRKGHPVGTNGDSSWDPLRPGWLANGVLQLVSVDRRRRTIVTVRGGDAPRFSPEGRRLAFRVRTARGTYSIHTMRRDGRGQRRLGPPTAMATAPVWSPDGRWVAWSAGARGENDLWIARPDGTGRRRLTSLPGAEGEPTWAPDGRWLAFPSIVGEPEQCALYLVAFRGGEPRRLLEPPAPGCDHAPAWKPR